MIGVDHLAYSRAGLNGCGPTRSPICKFHNINKNKHIKNSKFKCWHVEKGTILEWFGGQYIDFGLIYRFNLGAQIKYCFGKKMK